MVLRDRLKTLRRQAGQKAPQRPSPPALADRLQRLRPRSQERIAGHRRHSVEEVAAAVRGEVAAEGVILIERSVPLSHMHGAFPLARLDMDHGTLPEAEGLDPRRAVFFDTETTGLAGGAGTAAFMVGMGRVQGEALVVRQYLITSFAGERAMLEESGAWLGDAQVLVSFNGKSFDMPLLLTRCRLAGIAAPFASAPHVDLLHPTRRAFGTRWEDCRLATAERALLGFIRQDDLPGSEAPAAWFDYLHRGDGGRLPGVARHNHWDIVSLAALLPALAEVHHAPDRCGADVLAVARSHLRSGDEPRALSLLDEHRQALSAAGRLELARLYRRCGRWEDACALWEALAKKGNTEALESLAKHYEHARHDYAAALTYAARLPPSPGRERRSQRLRAKLGETKALL